MKRARFGLPNLLVFRERRVEKLCAVVAAGIAVRVHLEHVRERFAAVLVELVQGIANVRLVGGTHRSLREQALLLKRLAEFHNHLRLVVLESATFLPAIGLPPAGTRLVERFHRAERDSPLRLEVQRHFGEVVREVVEIVFLEVVAAVATARDAAALGHPPRGRIAERLENRALHALGKFDGDRALVRVRGPVEIALFGRLVAGNVRAAVALVQMVMARLVATADIVAENRITETRIGVGNRTQKLAAVRLAPGARLYGPPAEARAPALENLVLFAGVHNDLGLCMRRGK